MVATNEHNEMYRFDTIEDALEGLSSWVEAEWYVAHVTIVDE